MQEIVFCLQCSLVHFVACCTEKTTRHTSNHKCSYIPYRTRTRRDVTRPDISTPLMMSLASTYGSVSGERTRPWALLGFLMPMAAAALVSVVEAAARPALAAYAMCCISLAATSLLGAGEQKLFRWHLHE